MENFGGLLVIFICVGFLYWLFSGRSKQVREEEEREEEKEQKKNEFQKLINNLSIEIQRSVERKERFDIDDLIKSIDLPLNNLFSEDSDAFNKNLSAEISTQNQAVQIFINLLLLEVQRVGQMNLGNKQKKDLINDKIRKELKGL